MPSTTVLPDSFLSPDGQAHFLALSSLQELSWRSAIEGTEESFGSPPQGLKLSPVWQSQVRSGLIPSPPSGGLQSVYRTGLAAFDAYSRSLFGVPFAHATPQEQDVMLAAAGNVVLSQPPLPSPPGAPQDAKTLFPYIEKNTFEGCYGLPEYRWTNGPGSTQLWDEIGFDGDTQPLGNSIYWESKPGCGPGEGPNAGFGEQGVYVPRGGYNEYRAVSYLDDEGSVITELDIEALVKSFQSTGAATLVPSVT